MIQLNPSIITLNAKTDVKDPNLEKTRETMWFLQEMPQLNKYVGYPNDPNIALRRPSISFHAVQMRWTVNPCVFKMWCFVVSSRYCVCVRSYHCMRTRNGSAYVSVRCARHVRRLGLRCMAMH